MKRLLDIQQTLNAPKDKFNSFGNYSYRSCEGILEAVKPLLKKHGLVLMLEDDMNSQNNRNYIVSYAHLYDAETGKELISTSAFAREAESKKGMDDSQVTGATSSYARKYALNGLFLIDDNKDSDTDEFTKQNQEMAIKIKPLSITEIDSKTMLPIYNQSLSNMENGIKETKVEAKTKVTL